MMMTTPKEALELKPCPFCGGEAILDIHDDPSRVVEFVVTRCKCGISKEHRTKEAGVKWWNTRATASLEGEDAVERVARIPHAEVDKIVSDLMSANYSDKPRLALAIGRAIVKANERGLATGLVPDEAAIRADEREKIKDLSCESLLVMSNGYLNDPADDNVRVALSNAAVLIFGKERALRIRAAIRSGGTNER